MKLDLINYIVVKLFMFRSESLAEKIYKNLLTIKENKAFFIFRDTNFSLLFKTPFVNILKRFPVFSAFCNKTELQFKKYRFNLFISSTYYGETRFYWYLCKIYNIKTAGYPHGIGVAKNFYEHNINRSDYLFLWGAKIKEEGLLRKEFEGKKQILVGNIRYDSIKQNSNTGKRKKFNISVNDKVLLFDYINDIDCSSSCFYSTDYCNKVLFSLLKIIPNFKDTALIIKVHPLGNSVSCRNLLRYLKPKNKVIILHKEDVMSLIPMCAAVVSPGATTLCIDTIVNKVPFVAANFTKFPHIPFQRYKAFLEVFNEKELEGMLKRALYDQSFLEEYKQYCEEFIRDFCYRLDGNSTNRFVSAIENLLKK